MYSSSFICTLLLLVILGLASLACQAATDLVFDEPDAYFLEESTPAEPAIKESAPASPFVDNENQPELATETLFCPEITANILEAATQSNDEDSGDETDEDPEQIYLATYSVSGSQINDPYFEDVPGDLTDFQEDETSHQEIWDTFITLISQEGRGSLAEYSIVTDGEGNILAAVTQTSYDPALWSLEVDIHDSDNKLELAYTLIHEYAHLLTLGPDQVTPSEAVFNNPDDEIVSSICSLNQ